MDTRHEEAESSSKPAASSWRHKRAGLGLETKKAKDKEATPLEGSVGTLQKLLAGKGKKSKRQREQEEDDAAATKGQQQEDDDEDDDGELVCSKAHVFAASSPKPPVATTITTVQAEGPKKKRRKKKRRGPATLPKDRTHQGKHLRLLLVFRRLPLSRLRRFLQRASRPHERRRTSSRRPSSLVERRRPASPVDGSGPKNAPSKRIFDGINAAWISGPRICRRATSLLLAG